MPICGSFFSSGTRSAIEACGGFVSGHESSGRRESVGGGARRWSSINQARRHSSARRSTNSLCSSSSSSTRIESPTDYGRRVWKIIQICMQRCEAAKEINVKQTYLNGIVYLIEKEIAIGVAQHHQQQWKEWRRRLSKWCTHECTVDSEVECCLLGRSLSAACFTLLSEEREEKKEEREEKEEREDGEEREEREERDRENPVALFIGETLDRLTSCVKRMTNLGGGQGGGQRGNVSVWMKESLLESVFQMVHSATQHASKTVCRSLVFIVETLLLSTSDVGLYHSQQRRASLSQWRCGTMVHVGCEEQMHVEEMSEAEQEEQEEQEHQLTALFERLAEDSNKDVARPAAIVALERMKKKSSKKYYVLLQKVVQFAKDNDDEHLILNHLKLYTAIMNVQDPKADMMK